MGLPGLLRALVLGLGVAQAQSLIDNLSFGHRGPLSSGGGISGWQVSSQDHEAQILSDKIILTPPAPGNTKGALWSENSVSTEAWTAEFEFRASGQESGSGNLQLWYTRDRQAIGVNSVYNVDNFDGMALVIDQYGGRGGSVRGFLNDGTQNFKMHSSLESIAFGHCDYSYRNLGRPSKVRVSNNNGLTVSVDDRTCFSSDKISLPVGYYLGLTASTAENPDSFEVYSLKVYSDIGQPQAQQQQSQGAGSGASPLQRLDRFPGAPEAVPDSDPEEFKSQNDQFADLHNRLQGLTHHLASLFGELAALSDRMDKGYVDIVNSINQNQNQGQGQGQGISADTAAKIDRLVERVENMEGSINQIKREVEGKDYRQHLEKLNAAVERVQGGLAEHLPDTIGQLIATSAPRMGMFVFVVIAVQVMLAGAYIVYKRRRNSMPKKYL